MCRGRLAQLDSYRGRVGTLEAKVGQLQRHIREHGCGDVTASGSLTDVGPALSTAATGRPLTAEEQINANYSAPTAQPVTDFVFVDGLGEMGAEDGDYVGDGDGGGSASGTTMDPGSGSWQDGAHPQLEE